MATKRNMPRDKGGRKPGTLNPLRGSYEHQLDQMRTRRPHVFSVVQRGAMFDPGWARLFFELIGDLPPPTTINLSRKQKLLDEPSPAGANDG